MTTAKTFDIHDYDFLYEDEIDVLEAETLQEAEPGYTGAHNVASGKQKSEDSDQNGFFPFGLHLRMPF